MDLDIYEAFRKAGFEEKAAIDITRALIAAIHDAVERRCAGIPLRLDTKRAAETSKPELVQ